MCVMRGGEGVAWAQWSESAMKKNVGSVTISPAGAW